MKQTTLPTIEFNIYLAGDYDIIRHAVRKYTIKVSMCVTVTKAEYIYTGGEESGAIIGIRNYPRFGSSEKELKEEAIRMATHLMFEVCQKSLMIVGPKETTWISRRDEFDK